MALLVVDVPVAPESDRSHICRRGIFSSPPLLPSCRSIIAFSVSIASRSPPFAAHPLDRLLDGVT